jgi:hypothetical protein
MKAENGWQLLIAWPLARANIPHAKIFTVDLSAGYENSLISFQIRRLKGQAFSQEKQNELL